MEFKPPSLLFGHNYGSGNNPANNWPLWKQKLKIYLTASGKEASAEAVKIAILLSCIGDEGLDIYNTFNEDQKSTFEKLLKAFDDHFLPKRVVPMETFQFHNLLQEENQTIDQYLTDLKKQAKLCNFICKNETCKESYEERMIRDQLIIGINSKECQLRLLREPDLTTTKIIEYCKSIELSKTHIKVLNREEEVNEINYKSQKKFKCSRCLYEHLPRKCPAYEKTCAICQKLGHFAKACFSNKNREDTSEHNNNNSYGADRNGRYNSYGADRNGRYNGYGADLNRRSTNTHVEEQKSKQEENRNVSYIEQERCNAVEETTLYINECKTTWYKEILVENYKVNFKLDTGSDVSILPKHIYKKLSTISRIRKSLITIVSYGNFKFEPLGDVILNCKINEKSCDVKFVVVDCNSEPLLGLDDCLKFNLIKRVNEISIPKSKEDIYNEFKDIFEGLGKIPGYCKIELCENAKPVVQFQRKIPFTIKDALKETLDNLESKNVIEKVNYPTDWVNSLMIVEKPNKKLRLCLDPKPLNKYIRREHYMIPTSTDIISKLSGKSVFSVIDMKDGFWQLELDRKSSDLCVFNSPFGRYKFNRLPFGISSSPEIFQRKNFELFGDLNDVHIYFDDIIIASSNEVEHDETLNKIFERARENNVKFNFNKLQYKLPEVKFMGYRISEQGIQPDEDNVKAVDAIEPPKNKNEILRILGLVKFFSKFIPNLSAMTANLRNLTRKDVKFEWNDVHNDELSRLKYIITHSPTLKIFNPDLEITIQCDASSEGLGCVLLQQGHPVPFASRTLTKSERRYAQIEKELLAICYSFEKFHYFVYGKNVTVQSDHKPLVPIFARDLDKISNRLQRMMLKLIRYNINIVYLPGKDMLIADILSRSYIKSDVEDDPEMTYVIHALYNNVPMSEEKKKLFQKAVNNDDVLSKVKQYCTTSWPLSDKKLNTDLKPFFKLKDSIYLSNDLLFFGKKIIVPNCLRYQMLKKVHEPHFGVQKTKSRARDVFYWPNMTKDIDEFVSKCEVCQVHQNSNQKETLISHMIATRPWQYLSSDFFEYNGRNYLLLVDSYSHWVEVSQTENKTADAVIAFCKEKFSQFGVPDKFFSDNMPYNSMKFLNFAKEWDFDVVFSSPHHHQSNGLAERYVGIVKQMLNKAKSVEELPMLLMEYRNTPLPGISFSPSQILLNKLVKTKIPTSIENLKPVIIDPDIIKTKLTVIQDSQKKFFDRTAKDLPKLNKQENILLQKGNTWVRGKVEEVVNERSYIVKDSSGMRFRRNRKFLKKTNLPYINNSLMYDIVFELPENTTIVESNIPDNIELMSTSEHSDELSTNDSCLNVAEDNENLPDKDLNINVELDVTSKNTCKLSETLSTVSDIPSEDGNQNETVENNTVSSKRVRKPPEFLKDFETQFDSDSGSQCDSDSP